MAKTILITGGTSGIGLELVKQLAAQGHHIVFTARSIEKAEAVQQHLQEATLQFILVDFNSLANVAQAAAQLRERFQQIDVLINNAGTWQMAFSETTDGIETNFAVNHLAPMLFTLEVLPLLKNAPEARIILTSSGAHRRNILHLADLEFRHLPYDGVATYSQSKLANLLFSHRLQQLLGGTSVSVNTVHPGYVKTALFNNMSKRDWDNVPDAATGARSAVYAALAPELAGVSGKYFYLEQEEPNRSPLATDSALAEQLWQLSLGYLKPYLSPSIRSTLTA